MKSSFLIFAGYNTWANGRLYDRNLMFTIFITYPLDPQRP